MEIDKQLTPEELARKLKNRYQSFWRMRNPDKVKQYAENHWRKKAEQFLKEQGSKG